MTSRTVTATFDITAVRGHHTKLFAPSSDQTSEKEVACLWPALLSARYLKLTRSVSVHDMKQESVKHLLTRLVAHRQDHILVASPAGRHRPGDNTCR